MRLITVCAWYFSEFNGEKVVQKAKGNVDRYYSVVGLLEEMDITIQVFEKYLPRYFAGASRIYNGEELLNRQIKVQVYFKLLLSHNCDDRLETTAALLTAISICSERRQLCALNITYVTSQFYLLQKVVQMTLKVIAAKLIFAGLQNKLFVRCVKWDPIYY